jgi:broad specificity phosphatase PhoE
MKSLLNVVMFCFVLLQVACTHKIYIVRHAEKSTEPKNDPHLTDSGRLRAADLLTLLKNKKINLVYSTNTNRTIETATPLATNNNIAIKLYKNDTATKVFEYIFKNKKNALIVGHSNTILPLLQVINIMPPLLQVPDWEYDNLLVVKYKKYCFGCANKFKVKRVYYKKYGAVSKPK